MPICFCHALPLHVGKWTKGPLHCLSKSLRSYRHPHVKFGELEPHSSQFKTSRRQWSLHLTYSTYSGINFSYGSVPKPSSHVGSGFLPMIPSHPTNRRCLASSTLRETSGGKDEVAPDVIEFLEALRNYEKEGVPHGAGTDSSQGFDLGRMQRLLARLGDPLSMYPVVHVAGTKGKGSTVAFITSILRAQGYSVGAYTSPHIQSIRERLTVGRTGEPISAVALQNLFEDVWKLLKDALSAENGSLTHFEILTALSFKYFARQKVDIAVVEAGLGGARDATNVIQSSGLAVAVITNVGEEHMNALGGSLESIAFAKAGIIKDGCLVVLGGPMDPCIENIFWKVAASKNAKIIRSFGVGMQYSINNVHLDDDVAIQCCHVQAKVNIVNDSEGNVEWKVNKYGLRLRALGCHQLVNAITAICAIFCLRSRGWKIQDYAIWAGLESAVIPGRFQFMSRKEADKIGCKDAILVLDGAHTAGSAIALAETLRLIFPKEPVALVVAMAVDKDHSAFAQQLLLGTKPSVVVATEVLVAGADTRSTPVNVLANIWVKTAEEYHWDVHHLDFDWEEEGEPKDRLFTRSLSSLGTEVKSDDDEHGNQLLKMERTNLPTEDRVYILGAKSMKSAIKKASRLLDSTNKTRGVVCVTGSLHAISAVISLCQND